jgi:hypothetical protein
VAGGVDFRCPTLASGGISARDEADGRDGPAVLEVCEGMVIVCVNADRYVR